MPNDGHQLGSLPPSPNEDIAFSRGRGHQPVRRVPARMPWWNPRYWHRRIWASVGAGIVIVVVVVAVAVAEAKRNAYPDYRPISYALHDAYGSETFFVQFNYFTGYDPAHGFVHYVPRPEAQQLRQNLTYASATAVKVDTSDGPASNPNASTGRFSVRLESKRTYNQGLFVFDVKHTPYACGAWPALWFTDPAHWPDHGEVDIMESVNQGDGGNQMTLHTTAGCSMGGVRRHMTSRAQYDNCDQARNENAGCGVVGPRQSFGPTLNDVGGGIMAVEWRDAGIRIWQFARGAVPQDMATKKPDPSGWGTAAADFPSTRCDIGPLFRNSSIVNIDLCGDMVCGG